MSPERWQEIEEVFQAAVEMPRAERAPFLTERCGNDEELKSEVVKLLASDDSAADFIEVPIWTDSRFLNTSAKKEISNSLDQQFNGGDRDNFLGKEVGVYKLTKEIGRGGMGAVYLADRADGEFQQRVAIKLIKRGMDSDFIVRRFRHERQILASFEHPFIARLLDGGTTSDGVPYFVMEFVEGETLYKYADEKRLNTRDRLKLFQKVCSALDYAHEKKIIHRDIKPSNIIINKVGSPKLLDFGIAKILDPNLIHESINPTASMLRMMTPDYASPEQVQGSDVTPQSDIYSLGVLVYELLTGHRPYDFAGRAIHEVSRVICDVMPPAPSAVLSQTQNLLPQYGSSAGRFLAVRSTSEKQLVSELTSGLDNIVMKAIAKDPDDRYESVSELSQDISRFLSGPRVEAPGFSKPRRSAPDTFLRVPENSKALAVLPFKFLNLGPASNDTDDRFLGVGLADALITRLSKVRRFVVRPTSSILSFEEDQIDPIRAGRDLNVDYILDGSIKKAGDRLRVTIQLLSVRDNAAVWATSIDETLSDVLTLEDTLSNKVIEALLPQLTGGELQEFAKRGTEVPEAFEHYLRGRYHFNTFTEDGFAKAFLSFHTAIAADPTYAHAYAGLADYYNWLGILGVLPPQECFQPAIEAAAKAIEIDDNLSEGHASLGFSLHAGNYEWSKAEKHLRRAMELNPSNANAFVWYSIVLFTESRFDEGLDFARRGAEIDPLTPFNHHNIGWGLYYARRFDEAAEQYRRLVSDFPTYSFGYYGLSKIHRITGETNLAIVESERANELMGGSVFSLLSEAESYAADGQIEVARQKIAALEKMAVERYVSPYQLALAYRYLDDNENALDALERAVVIKEAWLNWMGVEPAFDPIRRDKRFDDILEKTGYRMFFKNFSSSGVDLDANGRAGKSKHAAVHDLTTLVIEESDKTDDGTKPLPVKQRRAAAYLAIAAVLLLGASSGTYYLYNRQKSDAVVIMTPAGFQNPSIVVVPFTPDDVGDTNLGVGLADSLTQKLGSIKALRVLSSSTGRAIDVAFPQEVARNLSVSFILKGQLSKSGTSTALTAELVNAVGDQVMWSETFESPGGNLADLQIKIAEKVWTSLHIEPLPLERQQLLKTFTQNPGAYERYLVGRSLMTNRSAENLRKAIDSFTESSNADPQFVLAYIGLADAHALLNLYDIDPPPDAYEKAKEYVQRALSIDDSLAEAHATLAYVKFYGERNRDTAELEFRRALQLNPSYAQAHHWFAIVLAAMDDRIEAISEAQIAQQLDPRSPAVKSAQAMTYSFNGQYPEANAECDAALELDKRFMPAIRVKRWNYIAMKDFAGAKAAFEKELEYGGGSVEDPGWRLIEIQVTAPNEDRVEKLRLLQEAVHSTLIQKNHRAFAFEAALAYNALGETAKALDWLEKSEAAQSHSFNFLEVDPRIQNLKEEPRFRKLIEKLHKPR